MGIRFSCHICNHGLHVKDFQAGKRGRCPNCNDSISIEESYESSSRQSSGSMFENKRSRRSSSASIQDSGIAVAEREAEVAISKMLESTKRVQNDKLQSKKKDDEQPAATPKQTKPAADVSSKGIPKKPIDITPIDHFPQAFVQAKDALWFVRPPSGGQYGPAHSKLLMDWIAERRVTADSYLWHEGMPQWQLASLVAPEGATKLDKVTASEPKPTYVPAITPPCSIETPMLGAGLGAPSPTDSSISAVRGAALLKKHKQRRKQRMMVTVLAVASVVLLGVLLAVLFFQNRGT
jgi:predicted nucleic acid-binding Zn ribbon protein